MPCIAVICASLQKRIAELAVACIDFALDAFDGQQWFSDECVHPPNERRQFAFAMKSLPCPGSLHRSWNALPHAADDLAPALAREIAVLFAAGKAEFLLDDRLVRMNQE